MGFRSDELGVWFMFILLSPWVSLAKRNDEGNALYDFKILLQDPLHALHSWDPTDVNPCNYYHVTCDGFNRVIRIDLMNAGLSGPLSPSLGKLKNLQYLELFNNHFTGHIPAEIGNLTKLVSLDLYSNSLTGNLPVQLGNLHNLQFLDLGNSELSGPLNPSLGKLKKLQYLELNNNHFTGHIPAEIGNLANLVSLDLSSNSLTGNLPVQLGNLYYLKFLLLQNNNLCGRPPVEELARRWAKGPFHGNKGIVQLYPGNKYLCNPYKDKFCVPGCCKKCK